MRKGILVCVVTLITPALAQAQLFQRRQQVQCGPPVIYSQAPKPAYQQPAPPPYYPPPAPAPIAYPPPPVYPVQKVIAQNVAIAPLVVAVPVDSYAVPVQAFQAPYYYSVGQAYQEKASTRDDIRSILRDELRNLFNTQPVPVKPVVTNQPVGPPQPKTSPIPDQGTALTPDTTTPLDLQQKVIAAYSGKGNCLSCHGDTGKASGPNGTQFRLVMDDGKGGLVLTAFNSDKRARIYMLSATGMMPPAAANDASKAMETSHLQNLLQYALIR